MFFFHVRPGDPRLRQAVLRLLDGVTAIGTLPAVDGSLNTLLGISHTGYLANKAVSTAVRRRSRPHLRTRAGSERAALALPLAIALIGGTVLPRSGTRSTPR
jgi:hypothetical protein